MLALILVIPYMTWVSRMCGGGPPKLPWGLDAWLLAAPYLLFYPYVGWWVILGYLGAVLGLRMGHGRGFHYNLPFEIGSEPEKIEVLIPDSLPVYWQKFLIMAGTGLAVSLALSIILSLNGYILPGLVLALSGTCKALAYLFPRTEHSEYRRGTFLGLGVALALWILP